MNLKELNSFKLSDAVTFHNELNPKLWRNTKLLPEVRDQLITIAQDFLQELGVHDLDVKDITISGSNAAYSYTKHSDLDLHILVDMGNLPVDEVYKELFTAKKTIYNDTHDIKINNIPVELYVQDSRQPVVSLGEYSVMNDQWIRIPTKRRSDFDQTSTKSKYEKLLSLIEIALKSKKYSKVKHILDTIKRYRQAGLDKGGEFGPENLAYKMLRSQGYITKLYELRDKLHSEKLSFETMYRNVTDEDYDPNGIPPGPETKPTMPRGTVRVDVSDVYDWYKLGQNISNLDRVDPKIFGKGPPSTIVSFGDEDTEHKYIKALKNLGLSTTDIDPVDPNQPKSMPRQKVDPTYNVNEEINPDILDPRFKHKQKIGDYIYTAALEPDVYDPKQPVFVIKCYDDDKMIGKVEFYTTFGDSLVSALTNVHPDYQKQGIASTMYAYARMLGNTIEPSASQLPPGKKMWKAWKKSGDAQYLMKNVNEELEHIPPVLYHATYKQRLKNIKLTGLGAGKKRNWPDSRPGVVYLALDPHVAESYAETALDDLDADWDIVILQVSTNGLDPNKFHLDSNVQDNEGDTVEYHGIIPPSNISLYKSGVEENYTMQFAAEKTPPVSPYAGVKDNQYRGGISEAVSTFVYHITPTKNLKSIARQGLVPTVGDRSSKIAGEQSGIYVFPDKASAEDAVMNWLGDEFGEDEPLTMLKIDVSGLEKNITKGADYELIVGTTIEPSRIKKVNVQLEEASGYIPSEKEKNDPRFKTALTVDINPYTMKKGAKQFGWNISRAGIPPTAKANGKI